MKNAVFWDVKPCGSCNNLSYGGTYHLHHQGENMSELGGDTHRFLQEPQGITSQKMAFFIVTAMKTSNLTNLKMAIWHCMMIQRNKEAGQGHAVLL
jgi:hypothetical protein